MVTILDLSRFFVLVYRGSCGCQLVHVVKIFNTYTTFIVIQATCSGFLLTSIYKSIKVYTLFRRQDLLYSTTLHLQLVTSSYHW